MLSHASAALDPLLADPRLDGLASFHLVGDMETDDELSVLLSSARSKGMSALEFRYPKFQPDLADLLALLRGGKEPRDDVPAWARPTARPARLETLAGRPRFVQQLTDPFAAGEAELLRLNDWVYLGDVPRGCGAWAVAKSHLDLGDDDGRCRRVVLFKPDRWTADGLGLLRMSPYFRADWS